VDARDDAMTPRFVDHSKLDITSDLDMRPEEFACIQSWTKVNRFYITNLLGYVDEAIEVARSPGGGRYPVGTVIQLIPAEAMVKRRAGWSPQTNDWEFFFLEFEGDTVNIAHRGTTDVVNSFNGNCYGCHALAEPQWDLVCEEDHGCDPLRLTTEIIEAFQDADPRCR